MATTSQDAGALPPPGPIGRGIRLALGLAVLYFFAGIVSALPKLADGIDLANSLSWVGVGYMLYAMPEYARLVFSRRWTPLTVRGITLGVLLVASGIDLWVTGSPNGGVLGITYGLVLALILGILGGSFLVAAVVAAPG